MELNQNNFKKEKTEYEKITEYYSKISEYQRNYYKNFLQKNQYCDFLSEGDWKVGYILEKNDYYITLMDLNKYYSENNNIRYQLQYSEHITYFRKFTHPSPSNYLKERSNKSDLAKNIKILQQSDYINIFKDNNSDNNIAYKTYYFLRGTLYNIFDHAICVSKDKSNGVEEGFKIISIILEYLSEFYKYINNNYDEFINYKEELSNSELADLVLIEKKYAIFSFWEEANLLMNKIFFNNENYLTWFIESEKILQKIIPSSPNFKKITSEKKILVPLYESQMKNIKNNFEYKTLFGQSINLKHICNKTDYEEGRHIPINNIKAPIYIIAYFVDYFFALGGYDSLFSLSKNFNNIFINVNILENICLAKEFTNNFRGKYEQEKNIISSNLIKFMDELNEKNYNKYNKQLVIKLFRKGCDLFHKIEKKSNNSIFEDLYLRYILKLFIFNKNENKKMEILNDINNILLSIEYNNLFNEKNNNMNNNINDNTTDKKNIDEITNNEKYNKRDKLINELTYIKFCSNIRTLKLIEIILNSQNLSEETIEKILPILIAMYKNNFGYDYPEKFVKEISEIKKLIFDKLIDKLRLSKRNDINNFIIMQTIICEFCEVFTNEDKYFIFSEIKKIFHNLKYEEYNIFDQIFNFIGNYTCIAVQKINIYNKELPQKEKKDEISKNNSFDEKRYYGLEMIYGFLLQEQYALLDYTGQEKKEMINKAIDNIIKIIKNNLVYQKEGISILLNKIYISIKNQKDVIQHLLLLQKLVNNYNDNNNLVLDECLKNMNLFELLINELKKFLSEIKKPKEIDINTIENEYNIIETSNTINIKENDKIKIRIETIFSLMPNYTKKNFDFKNVKEFIKLVVQKDEFSRNICCQCLLKSIDKFSKDCLSYINSEIMSKTEIFDIRDLKAYQIYKKMIIKINMINNKNFLVYNKDVLMLIKENKEIDTEFKGIDTLWNLLLNEDQNVDMNIIEDITDFICELYFGIRIKSDKNLLLAYKNFYEDFINNVSQKLNSILISKKIKKNVKAIKSLILLIKKIINKSKNINGEIVKNIKEYIPKNTIEQTPENTVEFPFFGEKSLTDKYYFCDVKLIKDECFHELRYTLSSLYKIPVNQISLIVYMNNLGKSELNTKVFEKIIKTSSLKIFNIFNDFDNVYQELKGLFAFSQTKKKASLLIHVKKVNNIWEEIYKINIINIIYNNSKLPMMFLSLLKGKEELYTQDVLSLIKDNNDLYNKAIAEDMKEKIKKNKKDEMLFNVDNNSIYYINNVVTNLVEVINKNYKEFMKSNVFSNYINKLNIINDNGYEFNKNGILPDLNELYEKYKLCNNLLKIYQSIFDNEKEENLLYLILFKILNIYYYTVNDSIYINLNKLQKATEIIITTKNIKNIYEETLNNINEIIINNDKILILLIKSLVNIDINQNNIYLDKIKNIFNFISFDSIFKNKFSFINKKIKALILGIINKYNNNNINSFYDYLYEFYLSEKAFNKLITIFKEIENNKININNQRYEKNSKYFFDISSQILLAIFEYIKTKRNFSDYINKIISPKIFNYTQFISNNFPLYSIFPQLIIGGACKLYSTILSLININYNTKSDYEFIFNNYIMPNVKENILTPQNIFDSNKPMNNNAINIYSSFCIKEASNLFISLLFKKTKENNNDYLNYLNILNKYHNLGFWKGSNLSDWKLYYKTSEKLTGFIGLKNLGSTCYINTVLQIFNSIPLLKESLLSCDTPFSQGKNCLYQLKKVFYALNYLQTNYYTPSSFIENFDNKKLDPKIQMDIFEFLCNFIEKIELRLKNTNNENLLKYFFMGIQNDILAFENPCEHHRINQSNFYTVQLQVHNKLNLYQSLDAFIEGEKMEGDNCIFCEKCNKKIPAVKSQNFQVLPRILIFVLKRFEFNYNTMQKYKINDYYEFPLELNMDKYVQRDNESNNYNNLYKLKGIVIHSGNTESGHYYCYILDNKTNTWYEFNDTKISKFDIGNLDTEAFGKNEVFYENGKKVEKENRKNAYMLFYEKVDFNNGINFEKIQAINDIRNNNNKDNNININNNEFNLLDNDDIDEKIPKIKTEFNLGLKKEEINDILKPMNQEMYNYFLNKRLFSGEYHHFVLALFINILNSYKISVNNKLSFNYDSCINDNNYIINKVIKDFRSDRKNPAIANINNYLSRNKIILVNKGENSMIQAGKEEEEKILELFKYLIIYFFNVMIRSREKDYLGGTVDLIKYFINNYLFCADYLIEEFSNQNVLIEYMINCPSYDAKKLIVGIVYCAMINCIKSYENKIRYEESQNKNKKGNVKKPKKEKETKPIKKDNTEPQQQEISDEELARRLQEEENMAYSQQSWPSDNYESNNNNNNNEENTNPLERKYIPMNIVKLIYNILHLINIINFQNMNESRFLYLIIYRFSTISKKCKKFLLNKALVLEFLNILLFEQIKQESHNDSKIVRSMDKGCFKSPHCILYTNKKDINPIYDKVGAFKYENYITELYFYLLSHNQKLKPKRPYFEGSFTFDNQKFIKAIFFRINTRLDAEVFSYLIIEKCKNVKNYKIRIEWILENIYNILSRADFNENINYDINSNKDHYRHNVYGNRDRNTIDYENEIPKINPKYILLILKRFILNSSENKKIDEFRITQSLSKIFFIIQDNQKYYNFMLLLIDFIIELFHNNITLLHPYLPQYAENIKSIIDWIRLNPISPELYPIEGLLMYKSDNIVYDFNITEQEKKIFDERNIRNSDLRANKLYKILEYKNHSININTNQNSKFEYDYIYEALFDYSDFKFRKGDYVYYNKKRAVIKESLDELILIKLINEDVNKNKDFDEEGYSLDDMEKIKFWVAKDDKNISMYSLE